MSLQGQVGPGRQAGGARVESTTTDNSTGGFRPYDPSKGSGARPAALAPMELKREPHHNVEAAAPMAGAEADNEVPAPSVTPSTAPSTSTPAASASAETRMAALPAASIAAGAAAPWAGQALGMERPDWAGDAHANADAEAHSLSQRLESIGQRPSMPNQRLESLAGGNLTSMMSSSNGASLDALRALSSIGSSGIVPAFGQLAQQGAMGGFPAAMLQQQNMQQYLSHLPWMLRMQGAQGGMAGLFGGGQMGAEAPAPDMSMPSGMPLSETDGMPSLSGMSPSDAAAFLQSNRKRKGGAGLSLSSGENMKYSDDEGDGMGGQDDMDDLDGGDVDKVKRRLAQNREAARKSRQRRKAYVQNLEDEVRQLRKSAGQALGSGNSSSLGTNSYGGAVTTLGLHPDAGGLLNAIVNRLPPGSLPGHNRAALSSQSLRSVARGSMGLNPADPLLRQNEEVLQAFDKWRAEHTATVLNLRQAVNDPTATDAMLRPLVEEARGQLWTLFAMKKAVICSESVLIIMNMEHLLPSERLFAWLGGLRASETCGGLLSKLSEQGMANQQRMKLEALRESLLQQENTLSRGYNELLGSLGQRAAAQPVAPVQDKRAAWDSPDILGKLDAMRMTLLQADSVWEQLLEQTERFLTMRQYAVAVISLMETSLQLQTLHHPWLAALRRPVANE